MATDEITTGLDAVYINVDNIDGFGRTPFGKAMRKHFQFSSSYRNLNHGSYGTYPNSVAATFQTFQAYHEERPDVFIRYRVPPLIQSSLRCFADILNVPWQDLAMMPNACTGVDTVLRSLFATSNRKNPERDTIIYFSSTYGACQNIVSQIVESHPEVNAHCITLTFPLSDAALIASLRNTLQELGKRVGLVIIDTIVAMPGVRTPFEKLVTVCREFEGVLTLIDGAHGVGHIKIDLGSLKPDFFISNSHKWFFTPRPSAVFYSDPAHQRILRAVPTSWGYTPPTSALVSPFAGGRYASSYQQTFGYVPTIDASSYLCVPAAVGFRKEVCGGEESILEYIQEIARKGGDKVAEILGTEVMNNEEGTTRKCAFANVRLPVDMSLVEDGDGIQGRSVFRDYFEERLMQEDYDTFLAICWHGGAWWVRLSGQIYLDLEDFEWVGEALKKVCGEEWKAIRASKKE